LSKGPLRARCSTAISASFAARSDSSFAFSPDRRQRDAMQIAARDDFPVGAKSEGVVKVLCRGSEIAKVSAGRGVEGDHPA
jgi:hypothetical protein